ncbi:DUF4214 domain-containing protein [Balneatrix alpica]|uniref:DUF4214 domain-containing protein n=1 Tax=Balneatrix alpica TaxID=75684 RepID=UPI0027384C4B|nr:DUF4214 domain-containing protein [Balneatrix alpica]
MATQASINAVQQAYIAYYSRPADPAGLTYWADQLDAAGGSLSAIIKAFSTSAEATAKFGSKAVSEQIEMIYQQAFGRAADADGLNFWRGQIESGAKTLGELAMAIIQGASGNDKAIMDNKLDVANYYTGKFADTAAYDAKASDAAVILSNVTASAASVTSTKATADAVAAGTGSAGAPGQSFTLTTGVDNFTGTSGNDTFTAADVAGVAAWTTGDTLNGGAGTDTLNIVANAAITVPTAASVSNIETVNMTSGGSITADTSSWTGLTSLNTTTSGAAQTLTAAATTNVAVTAGAQAATAVSVNGGNNVTVTATGTTTGTTTVGATTAAAGNVAVNVTNSTGGTTTGAIAVTGGDTVTVTSAAANAVNTTVVQSAVTVTGDAQTTAVTVNQDKTVAAAATVVGKTAGAVTINDANAASATAAGTIASVSLNSYGNSTINSGALTTLTLAGTGGTLGVTAGALTTPVVSTLALNVSDLTAGAITLDADYTTLNIAGSTTASTIANVTGAGVTTINVSGDAAVTLTDNTFAALTSVTVTNTAGATFGTTALATGVTFTGGAGADSVILSNGFTKAITMGAGNDTVTYGGAAGTGGSVAAGEGTDTIIMTAAQADAADANSTFNTTFTGFETLQISDAMNVTVDLDGLNAATKVVLAAGANGGTINNLVSGGTVQLNADSAGTLTVGVKSALASASDVLNLALNKSGGVLAANAITAANVETINISAPDAATAGSAAAINTMTLTAAAATKITVTGNNGLNLTATGSTAVTDFDASGVVANGTADTAANLAVTYASLNATSTANVSIKGGEGNDTLTGNAGIDTITGGAGADILKGGANADVINVGNGRDAVLVDSFKGVSVDSGTALFDSVNGFVMGSAFTTATNISTVANFQAASVGGANATVLGIDMDQDGANTDQGITVEANGTGAGQAAGVTYTVTNGILTLSGAGASTVDTLGEWLTEAAAVAATDGEILAFEFGSDTYVFGQNGAQDVLIKLVGVTGAAALAEGGAASTGAANTIWFVDIA